MNRIGDDVHRAAAVSVAVILMAGVGIGCTQRTTDSSTSIVPSVSGVASRTEEPLGPMTASVEDLGIRLSATLDRGSTAFGDRVWVDAVVENLGPGVAVWEHGGGCEWPVAIRVAPDTAARALDAGRDDWPGDLGILKRILTPDDPVQPRFFLAEERVGTDMGNGCFAIRVPEELPEGGAVDHRAAWDTDAYMGMPPIPGVYTVEVIFTFTRGAPFETADRQMVTATLPLTVEGQHIDWLSPEQAIDALLSDERFVDLLADAPRDQWLHNSISFEEDRWVVTLKLGTSPVDPVDPVPDAALIGAIDARSGLVLEVRRETYKAPEG